MANILHVEREANKITLGTTGTTINIASHTASKILALDASKNLEVVTIGTSLDYTRPTLNTIQDIRTTASPEFTTLSLTKTFGANNAVENLLTITADYGSATAEGFGGAIKFVGRTVGNGLWDAAQIAAVVDAPANNQQGLSFYTTPNADNLTKVFQISSVGTVYIKERTVAFDDQAAWGQIWVKNDDPNTLWFTDDGGTDFNIAPQHLLTTSSPTFAGLTINGAISSATMTITESADDTDVSGVNTLFVNTTGGDVILGGLVGGVDGQKLSVIKIVAVNDLILEHEEGIGGDTDDFFMHQIDDEIIDSGGVPLVFNGTTEKWYDVSHAKHV